VKKSSLPELHKVVLLFAISFLLTPSTTQAATPLLDRVITITFEKERTDMVLKKISEVGDFTFSYNPAIVDQTKTISATYTNKTVREILDALFGGVIQYKTHGNYIILTKAPASAKAEERLYSGYVVDETTGERLKNVSVYDPLSLSSAVTDASGYFQIKIDRPPSDLFLAINRQNYSDTLVVVPNEKNGLLKIPIKVNKEKFVTLADSVEEKVKRFWKTKVLAPQTLNIENITDTIYRKSQLSILPFIGTNHTLSANVINDYSFNIFGGYSRGVEKFELGGLFNMVLRDMNGTQVAGAFNAVGGKTTGVQVAGISNLNLDSVKGTQIAGLINFDWNSTQKFSAAGLINFTHDESRGVHLAGIGNMTLGSQNGAHVAGLFNFSTREVDAAQVSGAFNFAAGSLNGAQVSLINFAGREVRGAQLAGLMNVAPQKVRGLQLSGLFNYATKVNGMQVGLVNIADSVKGVQLGLFSFFMKGYHKIEISADEIFYTNLAFRTGSHHFYNIFTVGAKPDSFEEEQTVWTFGYGIGTSPRLTKWLSLNVDLTANQIVEGNTIEAVNLLNKLFLGFEIEPIRKVAFTAGITLNGYVTDTTYTLYPELFTDYVPEFIHDHTYTNDYNLKMWWGAKVGLRFL